MSNDAEQQVRNLIVRANLVEQHRCDGCGCLLQAFGQQSQETSGAHWSCPKCAIPGATCAMPHESSAGN